jgi:hypothetical protein
MMADENVRHVYPVDDLIVHEVDGEDCPRGPETAPVEREDGSIGYVVTHHSLDGRELSEPDGSER